MIPTTQSNKRYRQRQAFGYISTPSQACDTQMFVYIYSNHSVGPKDTTYKNSCLSHIFWTIRATTSPQHYLNNKREFNNSSVTNLLLNVVLVLLLQPLPQRLFRRHLFLAQNMVLASSSWHSSPETVRTAGKLDNIESL